MEPRRVQSGMTFLRNADRTSTPYMQLLGAIDTVPVDLEPPYDICSTRNYFNHSVEC